MNQLLYGAAYYDEYMPYERLEQDVAMMKKAGINTVRIAESTWSTCEPQEGIFDFSHVERVMEAMEEAGIHVIIGTPTYAVPTWMVKLHPDILAVTNKGRGIYGSRQIMDITHPVYLFYAERVIRELMKRTAHRKCVIGFQVDNETKYYGTAGPNVQIRFVKYLKEKFHNDLDALNHEFGFDYWSNRINAWEDFPDVRGTINGSLGAEFEKFQRTLVDEFLAWQTAIVKEYAREDQFVTHNFDFEWRGFSYGVQPEVNHYHASKCLDIVGCDIYHPSRSQLTGNEIAFGGDMTRSLRNDNYLVIETEAQGFPCWTPYKGQLRQQAFSHLASGANSVMYWHWHSIHNACETYWKGLLSHDFQENDTYREACIIGNEFKKHGSHLVNLKKKNEVAILVSNESLTGLKWFGIEAVSGDNGKLGYNDVVRWIYDALYKMNIECDFVWPETEDLSGYKAIFVPALYCAPDELLHRLKKYVADGGTLVVTFKSAFTNEHVKVSTNIQPNIIGECMGVSYQHFTFPEDFGLAGKLVDEEFFESDAVVNTVKIKSFMELLHTNGAEVLAYYDHYNYKDYAAVTRNKYGKGCGIYIGCMTDETFLNKVIKTALEDAKVAIPKNYYPIIVRKGVNELGKKIQYIFNYSGEEQSAVYEGADGKELLENIDVKQNDMIKLGRWDVKIIEEN